MRGVDDLVQFKSSLSLSFLFSPAEILFKVSHYHFNSCFSPARCICRACEIAIL